MTPSEKLRRFGTALHLACVGATVVILAGMFGFVFVSLDAETRETAGRTASKQQFLETARTVTAEQESLQQQLDNEEARLNELFERIPATPQESEFLAQLAKLARHSGVSISQFSRGGATEAESHSGMEVQLSAKASHSSICQFLAGLANTKRLCHVRELSISARPTQTLEHSIGMTLRIFFAPLRETTENS